MDSYIPAGTLFTTWTRIYRLILYSRDQVAVYSNARTTVMAKKDGAEGWKGSFNTAFRAGTKWAATFAGLQLESACDSEGCNFGAGVRVER